jgi:hypothetical protein
MTQRHTREHAPIGCGQAPGQPSAPNPIVVGVQLGLNVGEHVAQLFSACAGSPALQGVVRLRGRTHLEHIRAHGRALRSCANNHDWMDDALRARRSRHGHRKADTPGMRVMRFVLGGTAIGALLGAVAGLILGVIAYPPTAWFATIELGLPAAAAGAAIGLALGVFVTIRQHIRVQRTHASASEPGSIQPG